ncbi:hypothetical protein F5X97DRAFT_288295 [Nemania serpens]|nr:hypothetical protein F5X97DRAFT_288295 [Nemania serpens]
MLMSQPSPMQLGALWQEAGSSAIKPVQTASEALMAPGAPMHSAGIRMGHLYDLIRYYAGHHEHNALWYRAVWDYEKPPFFLGF